MPLFSGTGADGTQKMSTKQNKTKQNRNTIQFVVEYFSLFLKQQIPPLPGGDAVCLRPSIGIVTLRDILSVQWLAVRVNLSGGVNTDKQCKDQQFFRLDQITDQMKKEYGQTLARCAVVLSKDPSAPTVVVLVQYCTLLLARRPRST